MALDTYANLKTAIDDWMARSDISGNASDRITLAEARLNRELGEVELEQTINGVASNREINVTSLSVAEPLELWLAESGLNELRISKRTHGTFAYLSGDGYPGVWSYLDSSKKIIFDRTLISALPMRFVFRQRFALSDSATTNWLLTNHPDIYLAAAILWGGLYTMDGDRAAVFKGVLDEGIPSVRAYIANQNRAELSVDRALLASGRRRSYNINTDR